MSFQEVPTNGGVKDKPTPSINSNIKVSKKDGGGLFLNKFMLSIINPIPTILQLSPFLFLMVGTSSSGEAPQVKELDILFFWGFDIKERKKKIK